VDSSMLAFLGISILVIVTPGPDTVLTIRNTLLGGRSGGVFTALGVTIGQLTWALATSAGMVAMLLASEPVFHAVKLAGAAYLIGLGAHSLFMALRPDNRVTSPTEAGVRTRLRPVVALRQGIVNNLGNPKMAAFFASILPQFAPPGQGMFSSLVLLGVIFSLLTLTWLVVYALAVSAVGGFLRKPHVRRVVEGAAGAVLIGLGARLATESR
jgi:threonine/homoserine/homoserine lactone efflux protein